MKSSYLKSSLDKASGTLFDFYARLHCNHFNVKGKNFSQDHEFFAEAYSQIQGHFDTVNELIRQLGEFTPSTPSTLISNSMLPDTTTLDRDEMYRQSKMFCDISKKACENAWQESVNQKELAVQISLENVIESLAKLSWMLESFI